MPAELRRLLGLWAASCEREEECALATVVRVQGSSYRKPGARMLITRGGERAGTVSGGCLEAEVSRKIWWLTERGPSVEEYVTSFDEDEMPAYGLGCSGTVTLLVERVPRATSSLELLQASVIRRLSSAIVTVIGTEIEDARPGSHLFISENGESGCDGLSADLQERLAPIGTDVLGRKQSRALAIDLGGARLELFAEYVAPPPAIFVFGAGDDAQPVAQMASSMGWEVTVADGRSNLATAARFSPASRVVVIDLADPLRDLPIAPSDAAVLLTHSYAQDLAILRALLPLKPGYLGVLGPRRRTRQIVEQAAASLGIDTNRAMNSVRSPIGLDLGVGSPHVIALSIVSEIQAFLSGRSALPLHIATAQVTTEVHG